MIFIDTGAFLARYVARDQFHKKSILGWNLLRKNRTQALQVILFWMKPLRFWDDRPDMSLPWNVHLLFIDQKFLEILRPDSKDELEALNFYSKCSDQKVTYTDCISFVLMKRNKINLAFSFDRHFVLAGFDTFPTE